MVRLETERLVLREISEEDREEIQKNINDLEVCEWLLVVPYPYTLADADWYIKKCKEEAQKEEKDTYSFGIALKESNKIIGSIGIRHINTYNGTADIGYWLGKNYHRKGYMYEAAREVIRFGFEDLGLRRINIEAFAGNEASNGLIKKLGFEFEGTQKEKDRSKATGKIHDAHQHGLLKRNWKKD